MSTSTIMTTRARPHSHYHHICFPVSKTTSTTPNVRTFYIRSASSSLAADIRGRLFDLLHHFRLGRLLRRRLAGFLLLFDSSFLLLGDPAKVTLVEMKHSTAA